MLSIINNREDDLKKYLSLLDSLLNSVQDFVFYKDLDGNYMGCNSACAELYDATATFITDGIEPYNHMVFNTTTGIRAVITNVIDENTLDKIDGATRIPCRAGRVEQFDQKVDHAVNIDGRRAGKL